MSFLARPTLALVGGGPRAVSLLERIAANAPPDADLDVHLIDDMQIGAGRIWRTDQPREMCMNTLAHAVTLFTDASGTMAGPIRPGPTLHEWSLLVHDRAFGSEGESAQRVAAIPAAHVAAFDEVSPRPGVAQAYRDELSTQRPESHPSRALYGEYALWCYAHARARLPPGIRVVEHLDRVIDVTERDGRQVLGLASGVELVADAVVAATGWMPRALTDEEREIVEARAADPSLLWVRPDSPIDQDLGGVEPGEHVIVRGLGMGFFDTMALLTLGRGGRFVPDDDAPGGLAYVASGAEPVLHATSHRGLPYRAKTLYGSLPPRAAQRHLRGIDWTRVPRPIDFDADVWPLILKDAFADYYETLARVRPGALAGSLSHVLAAIDRSPGRIDALEEAVAPLVPSPGDRLDLASALAPVGREFASPEQYQAWVAAFVEADLAEAERGADGPLKAALWSIASARGPVGTIGAFGGFDAESRRGGFRLLHSAGGMFGSGPPAFRNRQLLALMTAGVVRMIGPGASVRVADGAFSASSPSVRGSEVQARALIDAWMHVHDVSASADPLTHALQSAGRMRPFRIAARAGGTVATGGFDIDPQTGLLVHPDGELDRSFHVAGIPVDEVMHDAIISPMPGTDPTMLRETDRVARSALRIALAPPAALTAPSTPHGAAHE
ncbi:FAD/NAD(P)-binding protein [Microbacterium sp. LRZ72]|uniref:FAD/NAD(P)-binding protein n=1 Tax=Microbacterium sp. LRZ72 TaxID=2942481 RepID=UPI0029BB1224|nr:FAD/NAD(P)-binding protein [Microbacterium sp. LRZ72]MDX2375238.1 FAD/NAD(P)-binding protein [Microbacterium sp. LRZ72]